MDRPGGQGHGRREGALRVAGGRAEGARPAQPEAARVPEPVPAGRELELKGLGARTALVRQKGKQSGTERWFDWSANPYRGCEIGCGYCYARYSHSFLGHEDPSEFETTVYVKRGFAAALRKDLVRRVRRGEHVAFGTATDPYQPLERRERVTRRALRELVRADGLRVSITTTSSERIRSFHSSGST